MTAVSTGGGMRLIIVTKDRDNAQRLLLDEIPSPSKALLGWFLGDNKRGAFED
jgi:hypothetical protein